MVCSHYYILIDCLTSTLGLRTCCHTSQRFIMLAYVGRPSLLDKYLIKPYTNCDALQAAVKTPSFPLDCSALVCYTSEASPFLDQ
jgi:hypothetical protein